MLATDCTVQVLYKCEGGWNHEDETRHELTTVLLEEHDAQPEQEQYLGSGEAINPE